MPRIPKGLAKFCKERAVWPLKKKKASHAACVVDQPPLLYGLPTNLGGSFASQVGLKHASRSAT